MAQGCPVVKARAARRPPDVAPPYSARLAPGTRAALDQLAAVLGVAPRRALVLAIHRALEQLTGEPSLAPDPRPVGNHSGRPRTPRRASVD